MARRSKRKRRRVPQKDCYYCTKDSNPNWRGYDKLWDFLSPRSRILSKEYTGLCAKHQRMLATVVKRARHLGLLPFVTKAKKS